MFSKFSSQIGPKPRRFVFPFNNLTVLTGLAMLMKAPPMNMTGAVEVGGREGTLLQAQKEPTKLESASQRF